MNNPTSLLTAEAKAVKEAYNALNRNDVSAFLAIFDPMVERIDPPGFPGGEIYRGIEALRELVTLHRGNWAEGSCEPRRFLVAGNRIIVFAHVRVRLKQETEWREGDVADVFTFSNGKAVQFCTFVDSRRALEWAGVEDPEAH